MIRSTLLALAVLALPAFAQDASPFSTDAAVRVGEVWEARFRLEQRALEGDRVGFTVAWETRVVEAGDVPRLAVRLVRIELEERAPLSTQVRAFDAEQIARLLDREPTPANGFDLDLGLDPSWRLARSSGFEELFWLFLRLGTLDDSWMEGLPTWFRLVAKRMGPEAYGWAHARFAPILVEPMNEAAIRFWNGAVGPVSETIDRLRGGTTFQPGDEFDAAQAKVRYVGTTKEGAWGHFRGVPTAGGKNPLQGSGEQGFSFAVDRAGRLADLRYEFALDLPIGPGGPAVRSTAAFELSAVREPKE